MDDHATPSGDPGQAKASLFGRARKSPPPPREPKKKRSRGSGFSQLSAFLSLVLVGVFVGLAGFVAVLLAESRAGPLTEDKVVVLTREDDEGPIADQLEAKGVIDNAALFSIMALLDGQRAALKRGEYDFKAGITMREVEDMLAHHRVVKHKLPIPEGLTSEQISQRVRDDDLLVGDIKETPREGSLLPDTYVFERGDTRQALISHMAAAQTKLVNEIWQKRAADLPIKSPGELVTLASIVEKETGKSDERSRVAGVYINRLRKHMKLQSDPTIVYGLVFGKGTLGHPITRSELQEATPYNTYAIDGLPPGPICNPGRAAMEAAANPAHSSDLFFVADGTGGHVFAETFDQHQRNVARWRQIEKDAKDRLSPEATPPASNIRGEGPDADASRYGVLTAPALPPSERSPAFGALAFDGTTTVAPAGASLANKLSKIANSRRKVAALVGAGGSLSPAKLGGGAIDSLVVTGVNDPPPGSEDGPDPVVGPGPAGAVPLSPAALADLRARAARYGGGSIVDAGLAVATSSSAGPAVVGPAGPRAHAFDASEGTSLDPLRNRTFDLNYAKDVPAAFK